MRPQRPTSDVSSSSKSHDGKKHGSKYKEADVVSNTVASSGLVSDALAKFSVDMAASPVRGAEGLQLGSLTDTWKKPEDWNKFKDFLKTLQPEGVDGKGQRLGCERYATFLELYVQLHMVEESTDKSGKKTASNEDLKKLVEEIWRHPEGFFSIQRRLKVIEGPMRKSVMESVKKVQEGARGGKWVFQPVYSKAFDKLNDWLGSYHEKETLKLQTTTTAATTTTQTVSTTQATISKQTTVTKST